MNIVVLCGGLSSERDVSIKSGTLVLEALRSKGHNAVLVDAFLGYEGEYSDPAEIFSDLHEIPHFTISETEPDLEAVKKSRKQANDSRIGDNVIEICRYADVVFMALHGEDGENGKLQALFDIEGIKYTGSGYLGSAIAMNKNLSKKLLNAAGIKTPEGIAVRRDDKEYGKIGYPAVVKPCNGGSSVGISIVNSDEEYENALKAAFKYEDEVVVETFVKGRELTVGLFDGEPMPVIEIIPNEGFYDYKNKYQAGLTVELCPAPIGDENTKKVQEITVKAAEALMVDTYCRIDYLMDEKGEFYCLEANTLPGMTPTSLIPQMAAEMGMDYPTLCEKIIEISLKKFN